MVQVDAPGLVRYLVEHCERRPSLRDRVESELQSINFLLVECLEDFVIQSETGSVEITKDEDDNRWSSSASSVNSQEVDCVFLRSEYQGNREFIF